MPRKRLELPVETTPDGMPVWAYGESGLPVCNSRLRKKPDHIRCQTSVGLNRSNGRCGLHGGPSPKGFESTRFQSGKASRYMDVLTPDMRAQVEAFFADEEYLSLREEIGVAAARCRQCLLELAAIPGNTLKKLADAQEVATELLDGEYDSDDVEEHLREILGLLVMVRLSQETGTEFERRSEHLRRLVETEAKRVQNEIEQIPAHRALALFMSIRHSLNTHGTAQIRFLREFYPQVLKDPRFPNVAYLIGLDMDQLLSPNVRRVRTVEPEPIETALVRQ